MLNKKQSVISKIAKLFSNKEILLQHSVLYCRIDLYTSKHKLAIEVNEKMHTVRDKRKDNEREEKTRKNWL